MIKQIVFQLAIKHGYSLISANDALWISDPEGHGTLIIAVREQGKGYVLARTLPLKGNTNEVSGFRVYYDTEWNPVIAVNEYGEIIKDPQAASDKMHHMIEEVYLKSTEAFVRSQEYHP